MQDRTLSHFVTWPGHWCSFIFMSRWMALWLKEILDSWFWNCQIAWMVIWFGCSLLSSCIWRRQFVPSNALKKQSANRHYKKNDIELFRNTLKARKCWGLSYNIQRGDAHRKKIFGEMALNSWDLFLQVLAAEGKSKESWSGRLQTSWVVKSFRPEEGGWSGVAG